MNLQNATQGIFKILSPCTDENCRDALKSDFSAKVFVLRSMGNELVPSPLCRKFTFARPFCVTCESLCIYAKRNTRGIK